MDWASAIFPFENKVEPSRFVRRIWRTKSVAAPNFISVAAPYWEIVIARQANGQREAFLRGPETAATLADIPQDAEFFGIQFELGVHLPELSLEVLADAAVKLPMDAGGGMHLSGAKWETPNFENADVFAARLASSGVIARDPLVDQILRRQSVELSERSQQRRFLRATGLTFGAVRQIERAEQAALLLKGGKAILDIVHELGYSDQAHLTRSLKRYLGRTPGQVAADKFR